jgi:hypothetical protein
MGLDELEGGVSEIVRDAGKGVFRWVGLLLLGRKKWFSSRWKMSRRDRGKQCQGEISGRAYSCKQIEKPTRCKPLGLLWRIPYVLDLGIAALKNVKQDITWSECYNLVALALAMGCLKPLLLDGLAFTP